MGRYLVNKRGNNMTFVTFCFYFLVNVEVKTN